MLQEILTYIILAVTVAAVLYSLFFKKSRGCGCGSAGGPRKKEPACDGCASCGLCPLRDTAGTHCAASTKGSGKTQGK